MSSDAASTIIAESSSDKIPPEHSLDNSSEPTACSAAHSGEHPTKCSIENNNLLAVVAEVESYMRCTDLSLIRDGNDENFLIKLLLLGISGGKEEDIRNPSLLFDQLHSQGNRQVCQYQFKRYEMYIMSRNLLRCLLLFVQQTENQVEKW